MPTYPMETHDGSAVRYVIDSKGRIVGLYNPNTNVDQYEPWDDLRFPAQSINPAGTAGPPTVDDTTYPGTLLFDFARTDLGDYRRQAGWRH